MPRRERTAGLSERAAKKLRSLELAFDGELDRTAKLLEKIGQQRLEIAELQHGAELCNNKALNTSRELGKQLSAELQRVKDNLRKAKDMDARARAKVAMDAAQATRRIHVKMRVSNAMRQVAACRPTIKSRIPPPCADEYSRARYDFVRNHALTLRGFLAGQFLDGCEGESH